MARDNGLHMSNYQTEKHQMYTERIRAALIELPPFCGEFFRGIENTTSVLTRFAYTSDLKLFFNYIIDQSIITKKINEFTLQDLDQLKAEHLEMFLEYVSFYCLSDAERENHERAKARKLAAIRSLLKYFFKKEKISSNVGGLVDIPKIHEKQIVRLDANEVADLLDGVESGEVLSPRQQTYHALTKKRDIAILTLLLGTGIRVSELVGLNIGDIDFETNRFVVTRKGGNQAVLYFGEEVCKALLQYIDERKKIFADEDEALFLSLQKKRINQRSVQLLVKKYSHATVPLKKISPHKLRSTYGTMLYQETGDIYLVADVLGHKDVNTTKKHYAAIEEDRRKLAAKVVKLRED